MRLPNPKNNQEVFNYIKAFINKQGEKSYDTTQCVYRFEKKKHGKVLKCAAGCLIPKNQYNHEFEGGIIDVYNFFEAGSCNHIVTFFFKDFGYDINLLEACQKAHDTATKGPKFIKQFNKKMQEVAYRFNLIND